MSTEALLPLPESVAAYVASLVAERSALQQRVEELETKAEQIVAERLSKLREELQAEFNTRVSNRAVEIMASVGQPVPATAREREDRTAKSQGLTGLARAEAYFRSQNGTGGGPLQ